MEEKPRTKEVVSTGEKVARKSPVETTLTPQPQESQETKQKIKYKCCGFGFTERDSLDRHRDTLFHRVKTRIA